MSAFGPQNLKAIRASIDAALIAVCAEHGLESLTIGNISWSGTRFTTKLTAIATPDNGKSYAQDEWDAWCAHNALYGLGALTPALFGATFVLGTHTFTITGVRQGRKDYVLAARDDGKGFKFVSEHINKLALAGEVVPRV